MEQPPVYVQMREARVNDGYRAQLQSPAGTLRAYFAEATGAALFTLVSAAVVCSDAAFGQIGPVGVALAQGLVLAVLAATLGHVSGGQFNPAVTLAMAAAGRQEPRHAAAYVACQLAGAAAAGMTLKLLFEPFGLAARSPFLGSCEPAPELSILQATGIEAALAFTLVAAVFATDIDPRGKRVLAPASAGAAVALGVLWARPLTGAAINPARAFGPALASGHWQGMPAFWLGPLLGGLAAAFFYEYLVLKPFGASRV